MNESKACSLGMKEGQVQVHAATQQLINVRMPWLTCAQVRQAKLLAVPPLPALLLALAAIAASTTSLCGGVCSASATTGCSGALAACSSAGTKASPCRGSESGSQEQVGMRPVEKLRALKQGAHVRCHAAQGQRRLAEACSAWGALLQRCWHTAHGSHLLG